MCVCVCVCERERERERERESKDHYVLHPFCFYKSISNIEFYVFFSSIFWLYLICDFVVHEAYHVYTNRHVHIPVFQKHEGHEKWPCTWKVGNEIQHYLLFWYILRDFWHYVYHLFNVNMYTSETFLLWSTWFCLFSLWMPSAAPSRHRD